MIDTWKMALEALIYVRPSVQRWAAVQRVMVRARNLTMARTPLDLRRHYARVCVSPAYMDLRDTPRPGEVLSPRGIVDAAFGLRHLELVTGRCIDLGADTLSSWHLAVAS